ncbi:MAG TPA: DUF6335 family protein [Pyrinomonadaceae bacterium]|jgi:hypothetical protein|nr:DUF6335 family protein [Pyrinomonadaceae bacterium]
MSTGKPYEFYENDVPNPEIEQFMNEEIDRAPRDSNELEQRFEASTQSPVTSGGDIDAEWEEADDDGAESVGGHNPTPDQSDTEANAAAMGFTFEDNQEIDLLEKMQKRDRNRFELDEDSKAGDTI